MIRYLVFHQFINFQQIIYHNFEHQLSEIVFKFLSQERLVVNFLPDSVGTMLLVPISVHLLADKGPFEIVCQCMSCGTVFPWMEKETHGSL